MAQKTFARYWDFSIPSAEVRPTTISKVRTRFYGLKSLPADVLSPCYLLDCHRQVNTALQLLLMGTATVSPILPFDIAVPLQALQYVEARIYPFAALADGCATGGS